LQNSKVTLSVLAAAMLVLAAAPTTVAEKNFSSRSAAKGLTITEEGRPPWADGP